jgi:outer membrane protein assembly factor BamE (lipoprotein component of BamABCDE complex)
MNQSLKTRKFSRSGVFAAIVVAGLLTAGCTTSEQIRGFFLDEELFAAVTPGIDNINSVRRMLGNPSTAGTFDSNVWYYVSTYTKKRSFLHEKADKHDVLAVHFDEGGIVEEVTRYSLADAREISPRSDKTPTRGRKLGFLDLRQHRALCLFAARFGFDRSTTTLLVPNRALKKMGGHSRPFID